MDREKKIEIAKIILTVIAVAGILPLAFVAPNAVQIFKIFGDKKPYQYGFRFNRAIKGLERRGLVKIFKGKVRLTKAGEKELELYELKKKIVAPPKKWDKKWRVVAFDIWERRRGVRNAVRRYLNELGFVHLQNSVWVYPYECREVVELLKTHYKVRPAVLYMTVETIEDDEYLKRKFNLIK
jgi:DNA-binding transcriptional regulator PaaX